MSSSIGEWKHDRLPILTKANSRQWFNEAKTRFEAKDIEYVLTTTRDLYSFVGPGLPFDSIKSKAFKRDDANARLIILRGLDEFVQEDVEEMTNTKTIWEHLQGKFTDKRPTTGLAILRDLTNYTFGEDQKISNAWNDIKNKRRHLREINPDVAKAFSENQCFQILLNSLPEAYTSLADSLMTSFASSDEKIQKLMDKEDTLTNSGDTAMAAYRKSFRVSCFLCDGAHLVSQCPQLSKAQAYIKKGLARSRNESRDRSKSRKSRRHHHRHNSSASDTSSESSTDSEDDRKKKKTKSKSSSKEKKKKKTRHAHTAFSDTSDSEDLQVYGAVSDSESDNEAFAYIAAAKEHGALKELLEHAKALRVERGMIAEEGTPEAIGTPSVLWGFDPTTGLFRGEG